jgi:hypothetical protein
MSNADGCEELHGIHRECHVSLYYLRHRSKPVGIRASLLCLSH